MKKLLFIIALGVFTIIFSNQTATHDAKWVIISETDISTNYIDPHSIMKTKEGTVKIWEKVVFHGKAETTQKLGLEHGVIYFEIDCKEKKARALQKKVFSTDGTTFAEEDSKWTFIIPKSAGEFAYEFVCPQ